MINLLNALFFIILTVSSNPQIEKFDVERSSIVSRFSGRISLNYLVNKKFNLPKIALINLTKTYFQHHVKLNSLVCIPNDKAKQNVEHKIESGEIATRQNNQSTSKHHNAVKKFKLNLKSRGSFN
jgi:hypothetical protein